MPLAAEVDMPLAAEVDMPLASEVDMPPAAEVDMPPAAEVDMPPAAEVDRPQAAEVDRIQVAAVGKHSTHYKKEGVPVAGCSELGKQDFGLWWSSLLLVEGQHCGLVHYDFSYWSFQLPLLPHQHSRICSRLSPRRWRWGG